MKNKVKLKKFLGSMLIVSLVILIVFLSLNIYEYYRINNNFNKKVASILNIIETNYSNITEEEIIKVLNNKNIDSKIITKYSLTLDNNSLINKKIYPSFLIINISFLGITIILLITIFLKYNYKKDKEIKEITKYIEELNKKNYNLKIDSNSEDELSILKNEIYKTTVMLKETTANSLKDKVNLKQSLEDISHQLKTPLTSILVMLDNLIDDPNMPKDIQNDFIIDIKRQILNINFLVQVLLKLSKFDSNTINFIKQEITLKSLILEVIKNVSPLSDLKNINIVVDGEDTKIKVDKKWQIEALTNILKNCLEHSFNNSKIDIKYGYYNVYSYIEIRDYGEGISKEDAKHIFERFYKGKNSLDDSLGIGLALAKSIIEEDNGNIRVEALTDGTKFTIKYFK